MKDTGKYQKEKEVHMPCDFTYEKGCYIAFDILFHCDGSVMRKRTGDSKPNSYKYQNENKFHLPVLKCFFKRVDYCLTFII